VTAEARPLEPGSSWERVRDALEGRGLVTRACGDRHIDARCPAHEDGRASLTADYQDGEPGRVLIRCHAGCEFAAVVAALGLRESDTYDGPPPEGSRRPAFSRPSPAPRPAPASSRVKCDHRWTESDAYKYTDADGTLVFEVIRKACGRCGGKDFVGRRPDGRGGWIWKLPAMADRPLYRLPAVRAAVAEGRTVYVAEGEKDVHALERAGQVATCNPGGAGAGKFRAHHAAELAGAARVVIVADRDQAGYKHAAAVAEQLAAVSPPPGVVLVAEAAEGKDAADHLAAGRTHEELAAIDPAVKLAELESGVTPLSARRRAAGHGAQAASDAAAAGWEDNPAHEIHMSAGIWRYSLGDDGFRRGGYRWAEKPGVWQWMFPLPWCHVRIVRRDGAGVQAATEYLMSAEETGPRKILGHLPLRDGSWANELGVPLADDSKVIQAAGTAIRLMAHGEDVPEMEAVPRPAPDGRISVPVPDCLPGGYLRCAPADRAAALGAWREIAAIAAEVPKLAAVLGASVFAPYMRPTKRQTHWLELFGDQGQGKTTALSLAAGVWGDSVNDETAVLLRWNATGVGLGRHLGKLGLLPAFVDEQGMSGFSPAQWGELIFRTCEGGQRHTAEQKGTGTRLSLPWGGVLFTSGNGRVTAGLAAGKYAGLLRRVVSIPAPFTRSGEEAERLSGGYETPAGDYVPGYLEGAYGHLGAEVLERFTAADARRFLAAGVPLVGELPAEPIARGLTKHLHGYVAGAAMADEILGTGTALRDAAAVFARGYLAENGMSAEHDADRIIGAVREAIAREPSRWPTKAEYAEHLKPRPDSEFEGRMPGRTSLPQRGMAHEFAGVRADDGAWVAVFPEALHELGAKLGTDESVALPELFRRGVLLVAPSARATGEWITRVRLEPKPAGPVAMYKLALPEVADEEDEITGTADAPTRAHAHVADLDEPVTPVTPQVNDSLAPVTRPVTLPVTPAAGPVTPPVTPPGPAPGPAPAAVQHNLPAAPAPVPQVAPASGARFAASAVVADDGVAFLAVADRLEPLELPELGGLADVLGWAQSLRLGVQHPAGMPDDPVAVILPDLAARLGLPASCPEAKTKAAREHPALEALRTAGWEGSGELRSWMAFYRPGQRGRVRLWLPHWDDFGECPMWGEESHPDAATLAWRLGRFAEALGIGWRMTGGMTGADLARTFPRRTMRLEPAEPPKPALVPAIEIEFLWSRRPLKSEAAEGLWLHCYDGNGAYTSAYGAAAVNLGGWQHVTAPAFDPKTPGYWKIERPEWSAPLLPDPFDPTGREDRRGAPDSRWYATPTLAHAAELGYQVTPLEAYLPAPEATRGRWYEPWAARVRDARTALIAETDPDSAAVLGALKHVWHQTHSAVGLKSQGARRDHDHAIIATYRQNLLRRLVKIADAEQRYPLAIATDNVAYASREPDPRKACPAGLALGTGLGEFKIKGTLPMPAAVPLLGTGRAADVTKLFDAAGEYLEGNHHGA
jgi:hypothetical protein